VAKTLTAALRDPIERVGALYEERREELEELGWGLADVYLELGGGGPDSSELHARFGDFFNGQARAALANGDERPKLAYWAGIPERGAALRDEALALLVRTSSAASPAGRRRAGLDPRTRALVLAHNQIDAELFGHLSGAGARGEQPPQPTDASAAVPRGVVCVLGMSRSGTSLTARVLNVLGVYLGSGGELMPAATDNNPAGFWEHQGIADLNEQILATLGDAPRQRWRRPPPLGPGWEDDPRLAPHLETATELLRSFAERPLWGWKDPRTCLTLPFWLKALGQTPQLETSKIRYVICVRHPLAVAASLTARDGVPPEEAMRLWLRYTSQAVLLTQAQPRLFVDYEAYFPGWRGQAARLARFLGSASPSAAQLGAIDAHLDTGLRHHAAADAIGADLSPAAAALHALLAELSEADAEETATTEGQLLAAARLAAEAAQA